MSVLIIGPAEQHLIALALAAAKANPTPASETERIAVKSDTDRLMLSERLPETDEVRQRFAPQQLILGTYRAALSFEEQPLGLCKHLSVSSRATGKIPGMQAMRMVTEAFGFSGLPLKREGRVWIEEFEPGRFAINIVELEP